MLILSVVRSFVGRLRLSSTIARFHGVVGGSLYHLFKLNVRLSTGNDLTHLGDIMLQEVFVQRMSDLHPTDQREHGDFFTIIENFG